MTIPDDRLNRDSDGSHPVGCREETIAWCVALLTAFFGAVAVALFVQQLYNPDIAAALDLAGRLSIRPLTVFHPKPQEKLVFVAVTLSLPVTLLAGYLSAKRIIGTFRECTIGVLFYGLLSLAMVALTVVACAGLSAANPFAGNPQNAHDYVTATNLQFYWHETFLQRYFWAYLLTIIPALLYTWRYLQTSSAVPALMIRRYAGLLMYLWCGLLVVSAFGINLFRFPYTFENKYDFSAVYYSVVQVYYGSPMLVDNFINTYGLYPHFVVPLLKLTGPSIFVFSALMALLVAVCYLMLLRFIDKTIKSRFLAACCFTSIIFYCHFYFRIVTSYDANYASQPIRFVFPMLSLLLALQYLKNSTMPRSAVYLALLAIGVLWNPEFGILAYLSFSLFLCYCEEAQDWKHRLKKTFLTLFMAALILAAVGAGYALLIRIVYGVVPDLAGMFATLRMFSFIGAGMLDMPLLHPWNMLAVCFALGLLYSLTALLSNSKDQRAAKVFLITMLGIASFSYYEGRSHNWNLLIPSVYGILLLTIFTERLLELAGKERLFAVPVLLLVSLLASSLPQVGYSVFDIARLFSEHENRYNNREEQDRITANAGYIREKTVEGEKVLILTADHYQALYHGLSHTSSIVNPGFIDLFLRSDYDRILSFLADNKGVKVFYTPDVFQSYDNRILELLSARYRIKAGNGSVLLLEGS